MKGKTTSGFEFEIRDDALDNYELLEALRKLDKGEYGYVPEMVDNLLDEKMKEQLKNHVRNEDGIVSASKLLEEVSEIFQSIQELKNS